MTTYLFHIGIGRIHPIAKSFSPITGSALVAAGLLVEISEIGTLYAGTTTQPLIVQTTSSSVTQQCTLVNYGDVQLIRSARAMVLIGLLSKTFLMH